MLGGVGVLFVETVAGVGVSAGTVRMAPLVGGGAGVLFVEAVGGVGVSAGTVKVAPLVGGGALVCAWVLHATLNPTTTSQRNLCMCFKPLLNIEAHRLHGLALATAPLGHMPTAGLTKATRTVGQAPQAAQAY
jgi:hypothetical protein